ncbi:MAG: AAA family ATPase, partial [Planctomycetes bacterium]|nr:AAA family ATPase [Planctomycetota bacterium]
MSTNYNTNLFLSLYGRNKSEGCVVITGMTGVDKTTMCRMVLRKKECENLPEFALNRLIYDQNLFGAILQNFGILGLSTRKHTKRIKIYQLIQYLLKTLKEEEFALLVVDDDQNLILSKSEQEKVTSSLEENKKKHLQIMLTGQVPGGQDLKSSRLEQFYNNEKCMYQTPRGLLRLEAIQNYIERRLMVADPEGDMRFSKEALEYVRKHSLGIPSIRNLIYDGDFTDTYTRQIIETKEEFVENIVHHIALKGQEIATTELKPVSMTKIKQNILIPTATLFLTSMTKIRQNVLTPTATLFLTSMTKIRQNVLTPTTTLFLTSMTKIRQSILIPTTTLFLTLMTKIRQNVFTPTATLFLTSMTKIRQSVLTPTTTLFLTSMTKIRQNILTPTATLFLTSMTKIKQNILTLTATLFLTSMTKIRQNILTPTATLFLTSINKIRQNILIPTATLFLTSINKIRQKALIPAAAVFLVCVVVAGFFTSHSFFTKNDPIHSAAKGLP